MAEVIKIRTNNKKTNSTTILYSFDIFDTLVTRTTATPCGIFSIMEKHLQKDSEYKNFPEIVKQNFFIIRQEAENFIITNKKIVYKAQDINFEDIYKVIKVNYNLNEEQINVLMNLEFETELKNLIPISRNINMLKDLISNNNRVILISDMYHSEKTIRSLLSHIDPIFENITIYVSSEYNKTKTSGDLYEYVKEQENVEYKNWTHYGDNSYSDIRKAKLLGIKAIYTPKKGLKEYEKSLLLNSKISESNLYSQMLIGTAKLTRTLSDYNDKIFDFGCSYAGPVLYNYVQWIIEQSLSRGIKTLYFIARDGYIPKLIADEIIKLKNLDLKTKYIYGSRAAWKIPSKNTVETYINWIFDEFRGLFSIEFLAMRFNMSPEEFENFVGTTKYSKKRLKTKNIDEIKNILLENQEFKNRLIKDNYEKIQLAKEYFKQELNFNESVIAFVDVQGSGRTQDLVEDFIQEICPKPIITFYFYQDYTRCDLNKSLKLCYFATRNFYNFGIELLCRNLDGQTLGYKKSDSLIVPEIENINRQNLINWGFEKYISGILAFTRNMYFVETSNQLSCNSYEISKHYFSYFNNSLDKETADIIGEIPYKMIGNEKNIQKGAPVYTNFDYLKMLIMGNKGYNEHLSFVSRKRSDQKFTQLFEFNRKHESIIKFICKSLFTITNSTDKTHKEITILGIKIRIKRKKS